MTCSTKKFTSFFAFLAFALFAMPVLADEAPASKAPAPAPARAVLPDHYLAGVKRIVIWTNRTSMPTDLGLGPFTIDYDELDADVAKNLTLMLKPEVSKRLVIQGGASAKAPAGITNNETLYVSFDFDFQPVEYNDKKAFLENVHPDIKLPAFPEMAQDKTSGYYRNVASKLMPKYSKVFWPGPITTGVLYAGTEPIVLTLSKWFNDEYPLPPMPEKNKDKQP